MLPASSTQVTQLLARWSGGDTDAREALIPLVYDELRRVARNAVEFGALHKAHGHSDFSAIFNQPLQAKIVPLLRHANPFKRPAPRLQGLGYGVDAIDVMHEVSV